LVAFGGKADIGQNAENDAFDPLRHFGALNCCGAKMASERHFGDCKSLV